MKKTGISVLLAVCLVFSYVLLACSEGQGGNNPPSDDYTRPGDATVDTSFTATSKVLVAYFSKTNNTKRVAETVQELTDADIFEIVRKEPYPDSYTPTTEAAKAEKDNNARPVLAAYLPDDVMAGYDTVLLGFPIWWHTAPMAVLSFLNYYDLSGKTIYTFATSGGSPISESTADVRANTTATVVEGKLFGRNDQDNIRAWLDGLGLLASSDPTVDLPAIPEITDDPAPLPAPAGTVTESLTYERIGDAYAVTGETANTAHIVIPAEHENLPVTTIRESAFAYSRHTQDILSVTVPDSVTTIERNAFYNRSEMTHVYIGANSKLTTIGNNAFSGNYALTFLYIPSGVTEIGDAAFNNCGAIDFAVSAKNSVYRSDNGHLIETNSRTLIRGGQSGEIPAWLTTIAPAAFRRSELTELHIPATVLSIGNYVVANSAIVVIGFAGTEAQWNAVQKGELWNSGNRDVKINFGGGSKILVVYFSATGSTERVAGYIAAATGADLFALTPVTPYSGADLSWTTPGSRVNREHDDESLRDIALTQTAVEAWDRYDTVFIGYPIWWGIAAWPVNNFVKHNDFTGKTVIPFCTSSSSPLGESGTLLAQMAGEGNWQTGMRFRSGASQTDVASWLSDLGLAA